MIYYFNLLIMSSTTSMTLQQSLQRIETLEKQMQSLLIDKINHENQLKKDKNNKKAYIRLCCKIADVKLFCKISGVKLCCKISGLKLCGRCQQFKKLYEDKQKKNNHKIITITQKEIDSIINNTN